MNCTEFMEEFNMSHHVHWFFGWAKCDFFLCNALLFFHSLKLISIAISPIFSFIPKKKKYTPNWRKNGNSWLNVAISWKLVREIFIKINAQFHVTEADELFHKSPRIDHFKRAKKYSTSFFFCFFNSVFIASTH